MTIASSPPRSASRDPGVDVAAGRVERLLLAAHVVDERPATALAVRHHDLDAEPRQEPDRRLVDLRLQHRLGAAGQDRHAPAPFGACGRDHGRLRADEAAAGARGASSSMAPSGFSAGTRFSSPAKGRPSRASLERQRGSGGIGQHRRQHGAQQPVRQRPVVGLLDMGAGVVDQVHVVHAGRAGGHAGKAGQAAVDMCDHFARRPAGRSPACP